MVRRDSRTYQTAQRARAKVLAARQELLAEEEPMHRYPHPIPQAGSAPCALSGEGGDPVWRTQVLEQLSCQSQLLVDLLGAVNALTAALLCKNGTS